MNADTLTCTLCGTQRALSYGSGDVVTAPVSDPAAKRATGPCKPCNAVTLHHVGRPARPPLPELELAARRR